MSDLTPRGFTGALIVAPDDGLVITSHLALPAELTPAQARALADALHDAADRCKEDE